MKLNHFIFASGLLLLAQHSLSISPNEPSLNKKNPVGIFNLVTRDVSLISNEQTGAQTTKAKVGGPLFQGDTVKVGEDSKTRLIMQDGNVIELFSDSQVKIQEYVPVNAAKKGRGEFILNKGAMLNNVKQKYDEIENTYQVVTPSLVAGVRGTEFLVEENFEGKKATVTTLAGEVRAGDRGSGRQILNSVTIPAGHEVLRTQGTQVTSPRKLEHIEMQNLKSNLKENKFKSTQGSQGQKKNAQSTQQAPTKNRQGKPAQQRK